MDFIAVTFDFAVAEWAGLLLRWFHVVIGIGWIGTSFYFIWLDLSLRRTPGMDDALMGESWSVHGGGFYQVRKYRVAPAAMPAELHWFKWEAYLTWVSGIGLLVVIYYFSANAYLINPQVAALTPVQAIFISIVSLTAGYAAYEALCRGAWGKDERTLALGLFALIMVFSWFYLSVFSGRGALIHIGALIGTMMASNVFVIIIPNQRVVVADLMAGRSPDAKYGAQAKQRSLHNNYLTFPVILMMISNHYPMLYRQDVAWFVVGLAIIGAVFVRHYLNVHDAGRASPRTPMLLGASGAVLVATIMLVSARPTDSGAAMAADGLVVGDRDIHRIVMTRCAQCHHREPWDPSADAAPAGVMFGGWADIEAQASRIHTQAGTGQAMPPGNSTGITEDERAMIRAWYAARP